MLQVLDHLVILEEAMDYNDDAPKCMANTVRVNMIDKRMFRHTSVFQNQKNVFVYYGSSGALVLMI